MKHLVVLFLVVAGGAICFAAEMMWLNADLPPFRRNWRWVAAVGLVLFAGGLVGAVWSA